MIDDLRTTWLCLCSVEQAGTSGKTVGDLEKTVGLMKKVVERVQKENDALKRTSGTANQDKLASLQQQHETLKVSTTLLTRCVIIKITFTLTFSRHFYPKQLNNNYIYQKKVKRQYIAVGTVRLFIEPSAKHEQSLG